jgi:hypothetical protein
MDELEIAATQALAKQFGVSRTDGDLRAQIAKVLAHMLDRDIQGLFTMFYRLDIGESKVRRVFDEVPPPDVPDALTTLVIEREVARRCSWLQHARRQKDLCI